MIRFWCLFLTLLFIPILVCADDAPLVEFNKEAVPVRNEELRKIRRDNRNAKLGIQTVITIAVDDVTPSVNNGSIFVTSANTGATAITQFDDGKKGQVIRVIGGSDTNSSTIADAGNFKLSAGMTLGATDSIILYYDGTYWIELSRTTN